MEQAVPSEDGCCPDSSCCSPTPAPVSLGGVQTPRDDVRDSVREHYAKLIAQRSAAASCCSSPAPITEQAGYRDADLSALPEGMREASFGCGAPIQLAELERGETVLDIGSGAGLDAILAARRVGPTGRVIGLDMTPEMIEQARANLRHAGVTNADIRQGYMEAMPLDDAAVDCVVSNCVINLSPDKPAVFREVFRVLRPGGRMMVSDIVTHGLPPELRKDGFLYNSCVAGALEQEDYLAAIRAAGFVDLRIVSKRTYDADSIGELLQACCSGEPADRQRAMPDAAALAGRVSSVYVAANKPR